MLPRGFKASSERWAARLRAALSLAEHERLPAARLAAHLQIEVWKVEEVPELPAATLNHLTTVDSECWSAITIHEGDRDVIIVNSSHSPARCESNVHHELAHIILRHRPARVDVSDDELLLLSTFNSSQEEEASWLGGVLHLPRVALEHAFRRGLTEDTICTEFVASSELVRWRANVTGLSRIGARRKSGAERARRSARTVPNRS